MKNLAKLRGLKVLNKNEQKSIQGGNPPSSDCSAPRIECYNPITHRWSCILPQNCPW